MRQVFLENAGVVLEALSDVRVAEAWAEESVLEEQTVGSLAGHLARGSVWVVADYLDAEPPDGPVDYETAADYYAAASSSLSPADHAAIRERGANIAAQGHQLVVEQLRTRLDRLRLRLPGEPPDRLVAVYAGRVMRLDDYLWSRLVEQVVHLDDLARSIGVEPWVNAPDAEALVINCGAEVGRRRHGGTAMIRTLFRNQDVTLPVW